MIEVLKQALEALETEVSIDWTNNDEFNASAEKMHDAITSLRRAIAEAEKQEQPLPPVEIGVDVTADGASVVAFYRRPNAVMEMFYSQFHPAPQRTWQEPVAWVYESVCGNDFATRNVPLSYAKNIRPLYTHPPQRTEPVATVTSETGADITMSWWHEPALPVGTKLFTYPPQRKPLTDEQIADEFYKFESAGAWYQFARAIEAAHGIKGDA